MFDDLDLKIDDTTHTITTMGASFPQYCPSGRINCPVLTPIPTKN
jgi:hypothetical protein